ncbi:MAG: cysteine desulfurase [Oscillospiraceae bacterium]|nr:cysteine desulfurase [Oscillospiraceae bacterium]
MKQIYLDYCADTPPDSGVLQIYADTAVSCFANPNSVHPAGEQAKQIMRVSLGTIAELLHIRPEEIIFTGSASEANNLAVKGLAFSSRRRGKHIVTTFLEHSSVSGALTFLQEQGWEIDMIHLDEQGRTDLNHLKKLLRKDTVLCSVCAVDSELGIIQPVAEIAELLQSYPNCCFHVDATQAAGKIPLEAVMQADLISFAPHKFYGLKGCGILIKKQNSILEPLIHGGASTTLYRSGTPDTPAAAACAEALKLAVQKLPERTEHVRKLNQFLREKLLQNSRIRINSPEHAVPHILNISVNGIKGEEMHRRLSSQNVCISVKSACAVPNTPSRAVMALTHDRKNAFSSWRISLSHLTAPEELEEFLFRLEQEMQRF